MRRHPADYDVTYERDGKVYRLPEDQMTFRCNRCGQHAFAKVHQPPPVWPIKLVMLLVLLVAIFLVAGAL